ncbi:MAG: N-acetylmuramoyl-L-alanine amidase [Candidatus Nanoarchaeia archaeon]|nr:N-acetylmuramoyl-L-alanine amidase [Candidatus Nanoarchaeia archaeon]
MKSIYLSPSTQEKNIGAENYGTEEKRANEICDITEKELKRHGIKVYRNKPTMTLREVVKDSNNKKPDIHFAIHTNAYNKKSKGCECFCYKFGSEGHKFAKFVYNQIESLTPSSDRGIKQGYNFYGHGKHIYEVAQTIAPAALIEIDFHDNEESAKWIINNIDKIGTRLAIGALNYFGIAYTIPSTIIKNKSYYRVMAGSFSVKENAENRVKQLKKLGIESTIMEYKP